MSKVCSVIGGGGEWAAQGGLVLSFIYHPSNICKSHSRRPML